MYYAVVETIWGGIGVLLESFSDKKQAEHFANQHPRDVEVVALTEEQMEKIRQNDGYLDGCV